MKAMKIDHIGYAVADIDKAITRFSALGYEFDEIIEDKVRNVNLCFGTSDGYTIELVSPLDRTKESPVDNVLKNGSGPYHICYRTDSMDSAIAELKKERFKVIIPPQEAIAFSGRPVAFLYNLDMGLIELVEN